ncbi:N-formylglutamate amidohydrolase [Desulfovibrio sp. X2]|uniref:N-formylglutamate amidohydrolase n=1 Tax=Desulfovibrio sp. X2 TaxID=941449 RepID=UPI0003587B1B|nr:N-formylglutamate amidohydrolase [Desulfovibrio sp. X2]EPR39834.1 N-formylglutamate amidohydrolase [Desulfovibrio sp. X2]
MLENALLLITCEHGGNEVPARYAALFTGQEGLLASHRGYDPGALALARLLARRFSARLAAPLLFSETTRLLADLNRSRGHPRLFSQTTAALPKEEREAILARHWQPHREAATAAARAVLASGRPVLHLASHSFTPVLDGAVRRADVGLLYDPKRAEEKAFCAAWAAALARRAPGLRVRRNQPYRGAADGLTTHLRRLFAAEFPEGPPYLGVEIEVNQRFRSADGESGGASWRSVAGALAESLEETLARAPGPDA